MALEGTVFGLSKGWPAAPRAGRAKAVLELGPKAEKWAHAILNPKKRIDKFGVKPGMAYQAWGEFDGELLAELMERAGQPGKAPLDDIFCRLSSADDLPELLRARAEIAQDGMIWPVWPKGRKGFGSTHVREFARANGLVDVKIASVSEELTSMKLVIPKDQRG